MLDILFNIFCFIIFVILILIGFGVVWFIYDRTIWEALDEYRWRKKYGKNAAWWD